MNGIAHLLCSSISGGSGQFLSNSMCIDIDIYIYTIKCDVFKDIPSLGRLNEISIFYLLQDDFYMFAVGYLRLAMVPTTSCVIRSLLRCQDSGSLALLLNLVRDVLGPRSCANHPDRRAGPIYPIHNLGIHQCVCECLCACI